MVVATADGTVTELQSESTPNGLTLMDWTPDGQHVLYATWSGGAGIAGLWKVPATGGDPIAITGAPRELRFLTVHPDANRVAFSAGESRGEVWVVEGLPGPEER